MEVLLCKLRNLITFQENKSKVCNLSIDSLGTVYLNIIEPYPGVQMNLKIKGKEECWWESDGERNYRQQNGINCAKEDKNYFYSHCISLHSFSG